MNLERKKDNKRLAIFYGKQSINLFQTVRGSINPLEDEIRRNFLSSVENAYRTLAAILIEEGRIFEAQQVLGLLKEEEFRQFTRRTTDSVPSSIHRIDLNAEENKAAQTYRDLTDKITTTTRRVSELELEKLELEKRGQPLTPEKQTELQKLQTELSALNNKFIEFLRELSGTFNQPKTANTLETTNSQTQAWQKKLADLGNGTVLLTTLLTENRYYTLFT